MPCSFPPAYSAYYAPLPLDLTPSVRVLVEGVAYQLFFHSCNNSEMLLCGYGRQRVCDGLFDAVSNGLTFSNEIIHIFVGLFVEFDVEVEVGGTKVLHRRAPI